MDCLEDEKKNHQNYSGESIDEEYLTVEKPLRPRNLRVAGARNNLPPRLVDLAKNIWTGQFCQILATNQINFKKSTVRTNNI